MQNKRTQPTIREMWIIFYLVFKQVALVTCFFISLGAFKKRISSVKMILKKSFKVLFMVKIKQTTERRSKCL